MSPSDLALFAVVILLALNHTLTRMTRVFEWPPVFWGLQLLNLLALTLLFAIGIPDLVDQIEIFNYVIGLLFIVHILKNNRGYTQYHRERKQKAQASTNSKQAQILAALQAGETKAASRIDPAN